MGLARRVAVATTWTVGATAVLTGGVAVVASSWDLPLPALAGLVTGGAVLSAILGHVLTRSVARPAEERVARLTDGIERLDRPEGRGSRLPELRDEDGARLAAAINGLMERVWSARDAQRADNELLRSLIENSPNGVMVVRSDGRIRAANPSFRAIFELRDDPVGRTPLEAVPVPEVQELVALALDGEGGDEIRVVPGARHVVLRPILTEGGEVAVLAQDLTRWRAAERARTDFVANVSHELRTPMAAILGFADTLARDLDRLPEEDRPAVEAIARNSRRLRDTFEGLMHLARVEARSGALAREPLRLAPLLAESVVPAVDAAAGKDIDFALDCPDEIHALTNAEALDAIVGNLATNAVKYTPVGGSVTVRVEEDPDQVRIRVQDTGIGIEPAHQDRIFERFFRVDEGRARDAGGAGLGLAMVKHLALATGARISVESQVGEGSTFTVHLPPAAPDQDEGAQ